MGKSISKARTLGEIGSILYIISLVIPNEILLIGGVVLLLLSVLDIVRDTEYKGSGNTFIIAMILDVVWLFVAALAAGLTLAAYKAYVERPGADCLGPMCDRLFPNPFGPGGPGRTVVIAALVASWPSSPHCVSELAAPADLGPGVVIKGNSLGRFRWRRTTEKQRPSGGIPV